MEPSSATSPAASRPPVDARDIGPLHEVSTLLSGPDQDEELLARVVEAALELLDADAASLHELHGDEELRLLVQRGFPPTVAEGWATLSPAESGSLFAHPVRAGQRLVVRDVSEGDSPGRGDGRETLDRHGIRALQGTPLVSREGAVVGLLSTYWRRPRAPEERELRLVDVLARQAADLLDRRRTEARLRTALRTRDDFLGLVSHELRTPLTIVLGMSRIIAKGKLDPGTAVALARDISDSAEDLAASLEAMLLITRLEHLDESPKEPVMLHHIAEDVLERQRRRDPGRRYSVRRSEHEPIVEGQAELLERVVANLVQNAAKYSTTGQPIVVAVEEAPDDHLALRVLDHGPGLSDAQASRVFEPFYRGPQGTWTVPGVGLGLTVCDRVISALDGRIWAHRRQGGGMEFGFSLPRSVPAEEP